MDFVFFIRLSRFSSVFTYCVSKFSVCDRNIREIFTICCILHGEKYLSGYMCFQQSTCVQIGGIEETAEVPTVPGTGFQCYAVPEK